jgi:hypothetical protein
MLYNIKEKKIYTHPPPQELVELRVDGIETGG